MPWKWKKFDIFLALLVLLTVLIYFFGSPPGRLGFFFWLTVILATLRLFQLIKKRVLWKIRNRLIVSALFFTVTPIVLMTIFFLLIINIVIYQYNTKIFENVMNAQIAGLRESSDTILKSDDPQNIIPHLRRLVARKPEEVNVLLWQRVGDQRQALFQHPAAPVLTPAACRRISSVFKAGYYQWNGKIYFGVFAAERNLEMVLSLAVDQKFFDGWPKLADFRIMFLSPTESTVSRNGLSVRLQPREDELFEKYRFPWPYTYKFLDFDAPGEAAAPVKYSMFLLINDYSKILQMLKSSDRAKKVRDEIRLATNGLKTIKDEGERQRLQQKLDDLTKELQVLSRSDSRQPSIPIASIVNVIIGLFAFFIIASFFIGYRIVRVITKSVNQLSKGTDRIRKGDFSFRIKIKSHDQMHDLAESYNEMASGIDRLLVEEKEKERLEEEFRIARSIQLKLLPPENFSCPPFDIAAVNIPAAEIAGDYFDYFYRAGQQLVVLVADVSGKGASAAFYMAELKGIINYLQRKSLSPLETILESHDSLLPSFDKVTYITMNIATLDIAKKKLRFARSGHTPALLYDARRKTCRELAPPGVAIGLQNCRPENFEQIETGYKSGDILFFFSDGLSEMMNAEGQILGVDRVKQLLEKSAHLPVNDIKRRLLDYSIEFSEAKANADDLTFLIVKVR